MYTARPVREAQACLGASVPLGVVQAGDLPANCPPRCLLLDATLYVSKVCPPLPARATELQPATSTACARAASWFDAGAFCAGLDAGAPDAGPIETNATGAAGPGDARTAL